MTKKLSEISESLNKKVFQNLGLKNTSIFLVGAKRSTLIKSLRDQVRRELSKEAHIRGFDVYYPEELFDELLQGKMKYDLLELENMLAKSVHVVVILLESPGAVAELGAFSNHQELCNKLVLVVDTKYRKEKSFIMLGLVKYLKNKTESVVIYHNLRSPKIHKLGSELRRAVRNISANIKIDESVNNPIAAQHFLLSAIYALEPVNINFLNEITIAISGGDNITSNTITRTSLNILLRRDEITLKDRNYYLTGNGLNKLKLTLRFNSKGRYIQKSLDSIRTKIMNWTLRSPIKLQV